MFTELEEAACFVEALVVAMEDRAAEATCCSDMIVAEAIVDDCGGNRIKNRCDVYAAFGRQGREKTEAQGDAKWSPPAAHNTGQEHERLPWRGVTKWRAKQAASRVVSALIFEQKN